jgi:hypothetical protein
MVEAAVIFLTDEEMVELTGYRQPAAQIRWLQKWRIRHTINRNGHPKVTQAAVEGSEAPKTKPNFAALRQVG